MAVGYSPGEASQTQNHPEPGKKLGVNLNDQILSRPSPQGVVDCSLVEAPQFSNQPKPGMELVVDLNNAACRRRRRRQMSSLLQIYEGKETENGDEADETDEGEANEEEDISSSFFDKATFSTPQIENEVRATMAVGAKLSINFKHNDPIILKKMIGIGLKENDLLLRREMRVYFQILGLR